MTCGRWDGTWKGVTPVCESLLWGVKMGPRIREDKRAVGDPYDDEILASE